MLTCGLVDIAVSHIKWYSSVVEKETDHSDVGLVSEYRNGSHGKMYFDIMLSY